MLCCLQRGRDRGYGDAVCSEPNTRLALARPYRGRELRTVCRRAGDAGPGDWVAIIVRHRRCVMSLGAGALALDTAEPATDLIRFYSRHGYRIVETVQWEEVNYRSVVMSKQLSARRTTPRQTTARNERHCGPAGGRCITRSRHGPLEAFQPQ